MEYKNEFFTETLIINRFTSEDTDRIQEYALYKNNSGFETWDKWPTEYIECKNIIDFFSKSPKYWAIRKETDMKMTGFIAFNKIDDKNHLDIGHGIIPKYLLGDEIVEALQCMIDYAFTEINVEAVEARNDMAWEEQISPLYKLGFIQDEDCMILFQNK